LAAKEIIGIFGTYDEVVSVYVLYRGEDKAIVTAIWNGGHAVEFRAIAENSKSQEISASRAKLAAIASTGLLLIYTRLSVSRDII
jgi:hypothetical protein